MCTAIVSVDPSSPVPVLLVGVRDEFVARSWAPPGHHWPDRPGLIGGRDLRAGGTWFAVDPSVPRAGCVLNGRGRLAPEAVRASRGELPLRAAADGGLGDLELPRFDPFHLISAEPGLVRLWSWDGIELAGQELGPGLHVVVNRGLEGAGPDAGEDEDAFMTERIAHFRPRLLAAGRPEPRAGDDTATAWAEWLPLLDGDGIDRTDKRALLPLLDLGGGRVWGTTSVSLAALSAGGLRYDFSAEPGDPRAWGRVR
ncbi:NRDE family protein [Spirillospora sp. NPDC047279]|uniref:NRDE family protein n=1 Tax=Spirillospora sp. NPDC047279 TaxID=3155478 RepID=UPI0033D0D21F